MAKKAPTANERRYKGKVAELGCIVCLRLGFEGTPAEVHHQIRGRGGWGRTSDYRTIPVCPRHHQHSGVGIHDMGADEYLEMFGFTEAELVEEVRQKLWKYLPPSETVH